MNIAIPIFDRITALDAIGPYEVLSRLPDAKVTSSRPSPGPSGPRTGCSRCTPTGRSTSCPSPM